MESPPVQDKAFVRGGAPLSLLPFVASALLCKMQVLNKGLAMRSHEFLLRLTIAEFQILNKKNMRAGSGNCICSVSQIDHPCDT